MPRENVGARGKMKKRTLNKFRRFAVCFAAIFIFSAACANGSCRASGENGENSDEIAENAAAMQSGEVRAKAECVAELSSRRILYAYNAEERLPMASTTKIAAALTVLLSNTPLDEPFAVPKNGCDIEGSSVYLRAGEEVTVRELLYGLMLQSGNDCAATLALRVSGSIKKFARKMNETAEKAGALHTHFKNPHGLPQKGHYTTARDLTMIACLAMEHPVFAEIVGTKRYEKRDWTNKNKMLYRYSGAVGVKTGYTKEAGRCLVSAARRGELTLVCSVLSCADTYVRSEKLLNEAFAAYESVLLQGAETPVTLSGKYGEISAATKKDLRYPLLKEEEKYIKKRVIAFDTPILDGDGNEIFGQMRIYLLKNLIFSENLYKL